VTVTVLTGTARVGAAERPWSAVLKVVAPAAGQDDPADGLYWRREALLYGSGLLDDLPGRVCAPRCYVRDERADAACGSGWSTYTRTASASGRSSGGRSRRATSAS